MRIILILTLITLIFIVAFQVYAEQTNDAPWIEKIPYYPTIRHNITLDDEITCESHATLATKALDNAKRGVTLEKQLKAWNIYLDTDASQTHNDDFLNLDRAVIALAWTVVTKYPDVSPDDYGDFVFESCIRTKLPTSNIQI